MELAIIGGKLQGTEVAYLAKKANMKTLLIDWNPKVPARGLSDDFYCCDVTKKEKTLIQKLKSVDFILPAMENDSVLQALKELKDEHDLTVAFDFQAYAITSSKIQSDLLMKKNKIPAPSHYPDCKGLCIAKPSTGSGSDDVETLAIQDVPSFLADKENPSDWVIQEYLEGPSYSMEVIGTPGAYTAYPITKIHMDEVYDCNRVTAPCSLTTQQTADFQKITLALANMVRLHGIMDVEVIEDNGTFKVLEIDARIPSQTPTVVYHSSGINLLSELAFLVTGESRGSRLPMDQFPANPAYCSYEHFYIRDGQMIPTGERIMANAAPLHYREQFLGSDEIISDYKPGAKTWSGTFINTADTQTALEQKQHNMIEAIKQLILQET